MKANNPTEGPLTSHNQIEVNWLALTTPLEIGNSPILSYMLLWDNNSGSVDITVTDSDTLTSLITGLDQGNDYKFKVSARNIYGYGPFSDEVTIRASDVPDAMSMVNIISVAQELKIVWA